MSLQAKSQVKLFPAFYITYTEYAVLNNVHVIYFLSSHTSLRRHEQKHQGVHYKCAKCSRPFNDPSNLRRHEMACNGEAGGEDEEDSDEVSENEVENIVEPPKETEEQMKPHRCGYCHKVRFFYGRFDFFTVGSIF